MTNIKILFAFLLCIVQLQLAAQVRTIIPGSSTIADSAAGTFTIGKHASAPVSANLQFDLSSLPADAVIKRASIRMVLDSGSGGRLRLLGKCAGCQGVINSVAQDSFGKGSEVTLLTRNDTIFAQMIKNGIKDGKIAFSIEPAENGAYFRFYSGSPRIKPTGWEFCNAPRLVVYYTTKGKPADWAGYKADAQHASCSPGEFGTDTTVPTSLKVSKLVTGGTIKNMTLDNGQLYFTKEANSSVFLYAADAYTGLVKEVTNSLTPSAWMPSMSGNGNYYHTTTNGIQPVKLNSRTLESPINNTGMRTSPVTGADGSLYLCQEQYIKAYSPPPARNLIWQYPLPDATSSFVSAPSVSADDSFVYVTMCRQTGATGILRQINVLTKDDADINLPGRFSIAATDRQLQAPVIDINNNVFQLNGFASGNTLFIYKRSTGLQTLITTTDGNIAPPVSSGVNTYVALYDTVLRRYRGPILRDSIIITNGVHFMATDRDGNIYILDKKNIFSIYSFQHLPNLCAHTDLNSVIGAVQYNGMLVSPDGAIYLNSENNIYCIAPNRFSADSYNVTGENLNNDYTYRANNILFQPDISLNKSNTFTSATTIKIMHGNRFTKSSATTLQAQKGLILQGNFHVQKGATFSYKTGR